MNESVIFPMVCLNGSSKKNLVDGYRNAITALDAAIAAMCDIMPHGRDYQTMEPGKAQEATKQHRKRIAALVDICAEIEFIALEVNSQ